MTTTRTITYTYDPLNCLTSADYSTGEHFEYAYDAVGNRTAMTATHESRTTQYEYDAANRLTSVDGVTYTWDDRGNLVSDGTFTYTYNSAGRMVRAESVTVTLVYTYNAQGLRVAQSVDGDVTSFTWDWASGLPEMLSEGGNLYLVGHDTLARWDGATWAYHLPDALGSVRQATDATGAVTAAREWTPYGIEVGDAQAGLGYTGEWWDADAALLYLRARWYAPGAGRFTQRDPSRLEANPYLYAIGNPIGRVDPSGLFSNATIAASFGFESFEELLNQWSQLSGGDWGFLKMLQRAEIGDAVYGGIWDWTSFQGRLRCYKSGVMALLPGLNPPLDGGVVVYDQSALGYISLSDVRAYAAGLHLVGGRTDFWWWYLNNNQSPWKAYTTKSYGYYLPDYIALSADVFPIVRGLLEIGGTGVVDRYGNVYGGGYLSFGPNVGLPFDAALGYVSRYPGSSSVPGPGKLLDIMTRWSGGISGYTILGVGVDFNPEFDNFPVGFLSQMSGEIVFGGGASVSVEASYMWHIPGFEIPEWHYIDEYPMIFGYQRQHIGPGNGVECGC